MRLAIHTLFVVFVINTFVEVNMAWGNISRNFPGYVLAARDFLYIICCIAATYANVFDWLRYIETTSDMNPKRLFRMMAVRISRLCGRGSNENMRKLITIILASSIIGAWFHLLVNAVNSDYSLAIKTLSICVSTIDYGIIVAVLIWSLYIKPFAATIDLDPVQFMRLYPGEIMQVNPRGTMMINPDDHAAPGDIPVESPGENTLPHDGRNDYMMRRAPIYG